MTQENDQSSRLLSTLSRGEVVVAVTESLQEADVLRDFLHPWRLKHHLNMYLYWDHARPEEGYTLTLANEWDGAVEEGLLLQILEQLEEFQMENAANTV